MKKEGLMVAKTSEKDLGVFAVRSFKVGEMVVCGKPVAITNKRTDYSFQINFNEHVELDEPARLINHSCEPNLGIRNNQYGGYDFVAIRKIRKGEELTWDYCMTEYISIAIKGQCLCGSEICRSQIGGYSKLPQGIKDKYRDFTANYLIKDEGR